MKFKYISMSIALSMLLSACGDSETTISSTDSAKTDEENVEQKQEKEESKALLEIVDSTGTAWVDSIGTVWVHSAAIFENTGDKPVDIGETQMSYKSTDGSILGTSTMVYAVPEIVNPGETAVIVESAILDGVTNKDQYAETSYNFSYNATDEDPNLMETSAVKGINGEYGYKVTGLVKNPTDVQQEDVRIAAILYDADGNLLGALSGSMDVGLAPQGEAGFELSYPELPEGVGAKVAKIDVKSYGWTW
ncbi:MAG: FxLYD domain-containing protein [Lysinibacillus sp.]